MGGPKQGLPPSSDACESDRPYFGEIIEGKVSLTALHWPGLAWPPMAWPGLASYWPGLASYGLAWPPIGLAWPRT